MLLQDLRINGKSRIAKINKALSEKYGIRISENIDTDKLVELKASTEQKIRKMRLEEGLTPKDQAFARELLVLEGADTILQFRSAKNERPLTSYRNLLDELSKAAIADIEIGDDYQTAVDRAMREFDSKPKRFPREEVKIDLENRIKEWLQDEIQRVTSEDTTAEDLLVQPSTDTVNPAAEGDIQMRETTVNPQDVVSRALKNVVSEIISWSEDLRSPVSQTWYGHSDNIVRDVVDQMRRSEKNPLVDWSSLASEVSGIISKKFDTAEYDLGPDDLETIEIESVAGKGRADDLGYGKQDDPFSRQAGASFLDRKGSSLANVGYDKSEIRDRDEGTTTFTYPSMMKKRKVMNSAYSGATMESKENYVKRLRMILENEVVQAEVLVAAKSFGQEIQVMIEKIGRLTNEDLGPVVDQMRGAFGTQEAALFQDSMRAEMEAVLENLRSVKQKIDDSVEKLAAGGMPALDTDMDAEMPGDMGGDTGGDLPQEPEQSDLDAQLGDEFQDEFGAATEEEPLGRPAKESVETLYAELKHLKEQVQKLKSSKK